MELSTERGLGRLLNQRGREWETVLSQMPNVNLIIRNGKKIPKLKVPKTGENVEKVFQFIANRLANAAVAHRFGVR